MKVFCSILTFSGYLITKYVETLLKLRMLYVYTFSFTKRQTIEIVTFSVTLGATSLLRSRYYKHSMCNQGKSDALTTSEKIAFFKRTWWSITSILKLNVSKYFWYYVNIFVENNITY